jgi:hypothetical protein
MQGKACPTLWLRVWLVYVGGEPAGLIQLACHTGQLHMFLRPVLIVDT